MPVFCCSPNDCEAAATERACEIHGSFEERSEIDLFRDSHQTLQYSQTNRASKPILDSLHISVDPVIFCRRWICTNVVK